MTDSAFNESPETYKARKELKRILEREDYIVEEEIPLEDVTNNMEEEIWPRYRADIIAQKTYIIELDPQSDKPRKHGHGTRKRRIHDQWRDKNIRSQINLKTVRLIPRDILKQSAG